MRFLSWRFAKNESVHDYVGVLVPLEEAHLHSHSARSGRCEFEEVRSGSDDGAELDLDDEAGDEAGKNRENEGMLQMNAAEYTIEGLRQAVRKGERGRVWSEYECESS
jgi:hypothetical protein